MQLLLAILFTLVMSAHSIAASAAAVPILLGNAQSYQLAGHLEMLVDPGGKLTLSDILKPEAAARFGNIPGSLNRGYTRDAIWLRFSVRRALPFPDNAWLRLEPPIIDEITVYQQIDDSSESPSSYRETRLGDHVPVMERPVRNMEFILPLTLPPDKTTNFLIRVKSSSTINLAGFIHTPEDVIAHNTSYILFQGGYIGTTLVIALTHLIFYLRTRDRLTLLFSNLVIILFFQQLGLSGIINLIFPRWAHILSDYLVGMSFGAIALAFAHFCTQLFNTRKMPWPHRYLQLSILVGLLTMAAVPTRFYGTVAPGNALCLLGTFLLMLLLSVRAVRNREPGGWIYLAAYGVSNIGSAVQLLRLLGFYRVTWWSLNATQAGTFLTMVMMSLALVERLVVAEKKALAAAMKTEQHAVELAREMTLELRDKQQSLEEALERQVRFVDMVSHEYRTPLAIIKTNLDLLRDSYGQFRQTATLETMQRAVARLVEIVEISLGVSRLIGTSGDTSRLERIEVADFLSELRDEACTLWPGVDLSFPPQNAALIFVLADRSQLKTAFLNLIENANKYGGNAGLITIAMTSASNQVSISVADQGEGIAAEELADVRKKFRRGRSSSGKTGAGIGLYLVDRIVLDHGGEFEIRPNVPHGTVATIVLPCCA